MTGTAAGFRINYNPPPPPVVVAPPVDYQPPYFPPPYSVPPTQTAEFQHQHHQAPVGHFDAYRVYPPHQQPPHHQQQLMTMNGHQTHDQQPPAGYYQQTDRYLLGDAIQRGGGGGVGGGFVVPPVLQPLQEPDGMDYVCVGAAPPPVLAGHHARDVVSPTYHKDVCDATERRGLTTSSCLRLIGIDNDDRDQVP